VNANPYDYYEGPLPENASGGPIEVNFRKENLKLDLYYATQVYDYARAKLGTGGSDVVSALTVAPDFDPMPQDKFLHYPYQIEKYVWAHDAITAFPPPAGGSGWGPRSRTSAWAAARSWP